MDRFPSCVSPIKWDSIWNSTYSKILANYVDKYITSKNRNRNYKRDIIPLLSHIYKLWKSICCGTLSKWDSIHVTTVL